MSIKVEVEKRKQWSQSSFLDSVERDEFDKLDQNKVFQWSLTSNGYLSPLRVFNCVSFSCHAWVWIYSNEIYIWCVYIKIEEMLIILIYYSSYIIEYNRRYCALLFVIAKFWPKIKNIKFTQCYQNSYSRTSTLTILFLIECEYMMIYNNTVPVSCQKA